MSPDEPSPSQPTSEEENRQHLALQAAVASLQAVAAALAEMEGTLVQAGKEIHRVEVETRPAEEVLQAAVAVLREAEVGLDLIMTKATATIQADMIQTTRDEAKPTEGTSE